MDSVEIDAYLSRLGAERPVRPTAEALRELHLRHLRTVPFENLSIHLGEEIVLEEKRLLDKVVGAGRGGFCYELNGVFGALLGALGFEVTLLAARVHGKERKLGIPYDHMALKVGTADGGSWLADVGFGAHSHHPLALDVRDEQADPAGVFRITEAGPDAAGVRGGDVTAGGGEAGAGQAADLEVAMDGRPEYRLERRPRVLADFVSGAWWHSTSLQSHFTQSLVCSRVTEEGGRITLSGRTFKETAADGSREERELGTDEEVLEVYRQRFGIVLDRVPAVRGAGGNG
ncbi:arylamine N-acetyltransferase family protein [Streptomyces sp. NRRL WC-3605]|uniref:arylamine N-acetyltransferase family protein n=1 Tax=Streptomyces sp. NRRL WC-3605 TaxID=1609103 RepID=UPI00074810C9|nr:arylamine N-acetyltransferase [Streptomyces sp. NRRL WC-3605]KUL68577.1 acetyltransferase [Streptomyces sp. NRRL WC-3605]